MESKLTDQDQNNPPSETLGDRVTDDARAMSAPNMGLKTSSKGRLMAWIHENLRHLWFRRTLVSLIACVYFMLPLTLYLLEPLRQSKLLSPRVLVVGIGSFFALWITVGLFLVFYVAHFRLLPPWRGFLFMMIGAEIGAGILALGLQSLWFFGAMQPVAWFGGIMFCYSTTMNTRSSRLTCTGIGRWCNGCDYDMKGLEDGAPCPECKATKRYDLDPDMTVEMEQRQARRMG